MSQPDNVRVVAITNQKGGVGKTTTAINLGASLAYAGRKVLLIDLDPQGNASTGIGIEPADRTASTYDLLMEDAPLSAVTRPTKFENLSVVPATTDLSSTDVDLVGNTKRAFLLRNAIQAAQPKSFDIILIDCPPSLSLLTVNALVAANSVLVPLQAEFFALEGLSQLMLTIREVRDTANPMLRIDGVVLTMYDRRNNLSRQVEDDARATLGDLVYRATIPRNVRLSEAPSYAMPIQQYDPHSKGAQAYNILATEFIRRGLATKEAV